MGGSYSPQQALASWYQLSHPQDQQSRKAPRMCNPEGSGYPKAGNSELQSSPTPLPLAFPVVMVRSLVSMGKFRRGAMQLLWRYMLWPVSAAVSDHSMPKIYLKYKNKTGESALPFITNS